MHWGHAVSRDLVNWQHLPIALYPDAHGTIFSGSAVIDANDSAGFGKQVMVAVFTHDNDGEETQSVAYSNDQGRTFAKYAGNPVLTAPNQISDFRDPNVIWYDAGNGAGHWVMVLAAGKVIQFYTSPDLVHWDASGEFGLGFGRAGRGVGDARLL